PLPTQGTTLSRNTPGKSSYANVIGESSKKAMKRVVTPGQKELSRSYEH
ncbi:hypothetical protein Tco_1411406, partial [Tanacetum coccineum]